MGLDGMGWEGMEYIEKISSKYLQNSTNKISKINNFYSTSNWIQVILIQISQVYTKIWAILIDHRALVRMECTSYINRPSYKPFSDVKLVLTNFNQIENISNKF